MDTVKDLLLEIKYLEDLQIRTILIDAIISAINERLFFKKDDLSKDVFADILKKIHQNNYNFNGNEVFRAKTKTLNFATKVLFPNAPS